MDKSSFENSQKSRKGFMRLFYALRYSLQGLKSASAEAAFRLELFIAAFLLPLAFWLGHNWVEIALLSSSVMLVLIVELLNSSIESAIDRIGPQWHALSGKAKDLGSAAVFLTTLLTLGIWIGALWQNLLKEIF